MTPGPRARGAGAVHVARVGPAAATAIARGHPWLFRHAVLTAPAAPTGAPVELRDAAGAFVARALWDEASPIAARVVTRSVDEPLDPPALARRARRAFELRDGWFDLDETSAFRLLHGEGDQVPGLVIDRYGPAAIARTDGEAMAMWLPRLAPLLGPELDRRGVRSLGWRADRRTSGPRVGTSPRPLWGEPTPARALVRERGMWLEVDLARGQKTGAFLDQRENRARVRELSQGRGHVLNLFSYAGGFSLAAALGGARRVTSVDAAAPAHATAQRSFRHSGVDPARHEFVTADVATFLAAAQARRERYDLIVSDPPSFAPSERARPRALAAYRKLHAACAAVLADGGIFLAASCSSHVDAEAFLSTLDAATLGRDDLRLLELWGHPKDHPTLAAWPEGRYLKMAVLAG